MTNLSVMSLPAHFIKFAYPAAYSSAVNVKATTPALVEASVGSLSPTKRFVPRVKVLVASTANSSKAPIVAPERSVSPEMTIALVPDAVPGNSVALEYTPPLSVSVALPVTVGVPLP